MSAHFGVVRPILINIVVLAVLAELLGSLPSVRLLFGNGGSFLPPSRLLRSFCLLLLLLLLCLLVLLLLFDQIVNLLICELRLEELALFHVLVILVIHRVDVVLVKG